MGLGFLFLLIRNVLCAKVTQLRGISNIIMAIVCCVYVITVTALMRYPHCSAAVSNAVDGRHTHCSTVAVCAADGRRTMNKRL
ncbi:MAG: hypothetical protein HXL33_00015 [Prevotellaceae bacterium]|nr:hypothetical protein [Prevotellaceae bacterium]